MPAITHPRRPAAFTLVELLIVLAMIAILSAIVQAVLLKQRDRARELICSSNLRTLGQGIQLYTQDYKGVYPPAHIWNTAHDGTPKFYDFKTRSELASGYHWFNVVRMYSAHAPQGSCLYCPEQDNSDLFYCPLATTWTKIRGWTSDPISSYLANSRVLGDIDMNNPKLGWHRVGQIASPATQMMLAESFLGAPLWGTISGGYEKSTDAPVAPDISAAPLEPNITVWRTWKTIDPNGPPNQIIPWHGGRTRSNVLFADGHVAPVTPKDGWTSRYQFPALRPSNTPIPKDRGY